VNRSTQVHVAVGRNINRLRNAAKLTQEQLAEKVDIDRRSLQRIEAGQWNMTVDYLDRLRRCLKSSWEDIFRGID
jgi:transcriptional regulator with XRE-family HTH domain